MNQEHSPERAPEPGAEPALSPAVLPSTLEVEMDQPRPGQATAPQLLGRAIFD